MATEEEFDTPTAETPTDERVETLPDPAGYTWEPVITGLSAPVGIWTTGDDDRLFVMEQAGQVWVYQNGERLPGPFLDIANRVAFSNERGLLGLAFHPRFAENGFFYLNYTDLNGDTIIARYQVSAEDPNHADPESETVLLKVNQPYANHNGGEVSFGPDGYLYLGLGDGGSAGDPENNAQSLDTLLGKILRIDVDGGEPYAIPPDNPFTGDEGRPEIWAYGLRNPWRFSFDPATGDLYIGDVGQGQWEEINYLPVGSPGGANFGWNYYEGSRPYGGSPPEDAELTFPIAEYGHDQGCSVTGGVVYRGERLPEWRGVYLYSDYCSGRVWGLLPDGQGGWLNQALFDNTGRVTSFGTDGHGEVFLVTYEGVIYQLAENNE